MAEAAQTRLLKFDSLTPQEQLRRSREFLRRMQRRRTVREFSARPVPFELIENAIRVAGSAPSGANQQPWTFVAISDPATKKQIRIAAEAEERISYEGRMSAEWLAALAPLGTDWHKPFLEIVPWIIVVFRQAYGLRVDRDSGEEQRYKHYYSEECSRNCRRHVARQPASGRPGDRHPHAQPHEISERLTGQTSERTCLRDDPGRLPRERRARPTHFQEVIGRHHGLHHG